MLELYGKSLARPFAISATEQNQCENDTHAPRPLGSGFKLHKDGGLIDAGLFGISLSVHSGSEDRLRAAQVTSR